jgi:Arc/MetJ-type ribon-helix-helix transcriptional regulator
VKTVKVELPEQLHQRIRDLVSRGWFSSEDQLIQEAIRRFVEAHAPELMAQFIMEDVEWGLKGDE